MTLLAGLDIGGTKCAVTLGRAEGAEVAFLGKRRFATPPTPQATLQRLRAELAALLAAQPGAQLAAIGLSCGGPLDSRRGLVLSPPNLPLWDAIDVLTPFRDWFGVPAAVQNDANAGALAEWQWGAGRGCENIIFLTFGTGMGAGLILNGRLYSGTNDLAGEVGHLRLAEDGPVGFHKAGSFEGFCSGGGIARLAQRMAADHLAAGGQTAFCAAPEGLAAITAETVGRAAQAGDPLALAVYGIVARRLGQGLAILVDVLNPQRILIGSIYGRQQALLEPGMRRALQEEALPGALAVCEILPAGLGERIGDYAALAVAQLALHDAGR